MDDRTEALNDLFLEVSHLMRELRTVYPNGLGFDAVLTLTLKDNLFFLEWRPEDFLTLHEPDKGVK